MNEGLYNYHNHNYHEKTARLSPVVRVQIKPFLSFFLKWDSSHASLLIPSLPLTKSEPGVGGKSDGGDGQKMRTRHGNASVQHVPLTTIGVINVA